MNPLDLSMLLGGRGSRPFIAGEGSREGGEGDRREAETLSFDALLTLMGASLHPGSPVMPPAPGPVPEAPAVEPLRPPLLAKLFHAPGEVPDREALASSVVEETASTGNASFETELSAANAEGGDLPAATNMPPRSLGVPVVWSTSRVVLAGGVPGAVLRAAMAMEDSAPALEASAPSEEEVPAPEEKGVLVAPRVAGEGADPDLARVAILGHRATSVSHPWA